MDQRSGRPRVPCVYIMASRPGGAIYVGVTSDLVKRVWEHKSGFVQGHTSRYNITDLVWYEAHDTMESAITREKVLKRWKRGWKLRLFAESNPTWRDLYEELM